VVVLPDRVLTLSNHERQVHIVRGHRAAERPHHERQVHIVRGHRAAERPPIPRSREDDFGAPADEGRHPLDLGDTRRRHHRDAFRDGPRPAASSVLGCPAWHDPPWWFQ